MTPDPNPPKGGGALSLYADLLDQRADSSSTAAGNNSRSPVAFKQSSEADAQSDGYAVKKQQLSAASLRFQPTRRPQLPSQKPKQKPTLPKTLPGAATAPAPAAASPPVKTTLADWTVAEDDDVNGFYVGEKRQRGGRKKRKKNREVKEMMTQNWDDIYDPSRPNNYEDYKHSDEKIAEVREWKDRLYAHRMRSQSSDLDSDEEYLRPMNRQFAPPSSFAPPSNFNDVPLSEPPVSVPEDAPGEKEFSRHLQMSQGRGDSSVPDYASYSPPPPPLPEDGPPAQPSDAPTGDDAYSQRLRMSMNQPIDPGMEHISPRPSLQPQEPPPRPLEVLQPDSATISRAPVRYTLPPPPEDIPASETELEEVFSKEQPIEKEPEEDAPRSLRPGQKGFAERLLGKYGWTKGSGLGANESGMVKPLQVKVEKQKKRPDSEGGGFATPAGRGKIIGGAKKSEDVGKFGPMSEVIILRGMLHGMNLEAELEADQDVGLMQEIGEECSEKYGRVERVFIHRHSGQVPVFVVFTSQLSALRAVNALEGRIFNGNTITARFFSKEKFDNGVYDE